MSIRAIMDQIVTIQEGLSITEPVNLSVKRAYKYLPPQNQTLTDLPVWVNHWQMNNTEWDPGDMREVEYSVNMMLAVAEATVEMDRAADIAASFWEATLKAFRDDVKLGGTNRIQKLRGEGPTSPRLTWAGKAYVGLDLWLDILVIESNA
jgi:hypothetical protein